MFLTYITICLTAVTALYFMAALMFMRSGNWATTELPPKIGH